MDIDVGQFAPDLVLSTPDQVVGVFDSLEDAEVPVVLPVGENMLDDRDRGRAAESARDHHHVMSFCRTHRPAASEGAAQTDAVADPERGQAMGDPAERADGVAQDSAGLGVRHHGDRDLTRAMQVQHVELPRQKVVRRIVGQAKFQGKGIGRFLGTPDDLGLTRQVGVHASPPDSSPSQIAAASCVISIPTGHQVMQRPQPTQPLRPYCSCQLPSLWVSH